VNASTILTATPYNERRTQIALRVAPRVAVAAADTYVTGLTTIGMPLVSAMQPTGPLGQSVVASAHNAAEMLPVVNGLMAAGHAAVGLWCLFGSQSHNESDTMVKARKLMAIGELTTAAGLAGQTFGLGVWAVPITALGIVTATVAHTIRAKAQ
jgi:hypothetical protein